MTDVVKLGPEDAAILVKAREGTVEFHIPRDDASVPEEVKTLVLVLHAVCTDPELLSMVVSLMESKADDEFDVSEATGVWH